MVRSSGVDSEELLPEHIEYLSEQLFPTGSSVTVADRRRLLIVPDAHTWNMSWNRLVPESVSELTLLSSAAAALRAHTVRQRPAVPRVISVFDDTLPGALAECDALNALAKDGVILFDRVGSLDELAVALASRP